MAIGKVIKGDGLAESVVVATTERPALRPPRAGVMNAEVFEARQGAQGIIEEAQRERERILAEAQREKEELFAKARDLGRQEGLAQATELLLRAKMQAGEMLNSQEQDIIALSLKMAEKILGRDLEREPELLVDMCAAAIDNLRNARAMVLRVHPKTAAVLRAKRPVLMELIGRTVDLAIKEDPEVAPVGCIVQTEFGTVDAQLPTQLEMLQNLLQPDTARKSGPP
ncbi:FliH/SctL family protein [Corallococcus carmarthensis]|uniref:Flagellar assembly protein FliH n=1 Tax=Corallococcus carmarthensis TaxID=2316728 RepID=A0A3A8JJJ6_9BACT|nr:FliH/SctL family protein [Corallococcus carmarthensis]NOK20338.1 flagellar assembly protein FliH [Corallococcus carmarthensis]RKG95952.1 flagellar assembly protein FliH [Corallococcus carmarthensis]